ncbi:MAG: type II toxin-antitoxin system prevent-host-death family antitoxin [Oscillospiraceae bacterium]|nr:type II toxin-antitoxin system prevent-host-death family antitoxin [Oscillospiraceae bacterium]
MHIKASATMRNNYNEISKLCKDSGEPVYLTKNGEGDLVVMDIAAFDRRAKDLRLAENLFFVRASRENGAKGYTPEQLDVLLTKTIESTEQL